MGYRNHKITITLLGIVSLIFITIKLFTAVVHLRDEPTVFLVFRVAPSFTTDLILIPVDPFEDERLHVLLLDENGFIGQNIYYLITRYLWWSLPILTGIYFAINLRKKNRPKNQISTFEGK